MAECTYPPGTLEQETCLLREAMAALEPARAGPDWAGLLEAIAGLLLPVAAIVLLVLIWRPLRTVILTRQFTIKIAGMELSAQQASEQLGKQIVDLQTKVAELEGQLGGPQQGQPEPPQEDVFELGRPEELGRSEELGRPQGRDPIPQPAPPPRSAAPRNLHILWVDDRPANNAFEIAGLTEAGHTVEQVLTTQAALGQLGSGQYDLVISDMGRPEGARAGLDLYDRMRADGDATPFALYAGSATIRRNADVLATRDMITATASPTDLRTAIARLARGGHERSL